MLEHKQAFSFNVNFDVLLYDLTSTYFESDPRLTRRASAVSDSRDRRSDCVQVVIALVVTPARLPLAYDRLACSAHLRRRDCCRNATSIEFAPLNLEVRARSRTRHQPLEPGSGRSHLSVATLTHLHCPHDQVACAEGRLFERLIAQRKLAVYFRKASGTPWIRSRTRLTSTGRKSPATVPARSGGSN
jgi:hypothetical protein